MRKQVNVKAISAAELERWKAEARRRGWTLTLFIRTAVNKEIERAQEQKTAGAA